MRDRQLSPRAALIEGDLLAGRYRLESLERERGASMWLAATDLTRGTRVTAQVVVTRPPRAYAPEDSTIVEANSARTWFLAGARRAKLLEGPHVARVLDAGVTFEGHVWIVREHLASETLAAFLQQSGAMRLTDAVDVALAVCDGIAAAHAIGLVHGAIGPNAVHVGWSAAGLVDVKVVGAGTATAEQALALGEADAILRAPEQLAEGAWADGRADVWQIAALLYTMVAGRPPFRADARSGASLAVLLDPPPALTGVPAGFAELVNRAMSRVVDERPRTVLDLAEALTCFATSPDFARDRISARRQTFPNMPPATGPILPLPEASTVRREPLGKKHDSFPPVANDVARGGGAAVKKRRDEETVIVRRAVMKPVRRRALGVLGGVTAAAAVALVLLAGTEGAHLAKRFLPEKHEPVAAVGLPPQCGVVDTIPRAADGTPSISASDLPAAPSATPAASAKRKR